MPSDNVLVLTIAAPEAKWVSLRQQFAILDAAPAAHREEIRDHCRIALDASDVVSLPHDIVVHGRVRDVSSR